jgi:hypothetical protein
MEKNMNNIYSVFADVMLWGSIPLLLALFDWEHGLGISNTYHILAQILLLIFVCRWALFWFTYGEKRRISLWSRSIYNAYKEQPYLVNKNTSREEKMDEMAQPKKWVKCNDADHEMKQRVYDPKH